MLIDIRVLANYLGVREASYDIRPRSAIRHFSPTRRVGDAISPNTR